MASQEALCHYCSLPVRGAAAAEDGEPVYCCLGCRVADSVLSEEGTATNPLLFRLGWGIFFWLNVMVFSMATWSVELAPAAPGSQADSRSQLLVQLLQAATVLFAVPVLLLLGPPVVAGAWDQLRRRRLGLEVLLLLGTAAAVLYSALSLYRGHGHLFLDSACMVLVAVTLGKWLEATARRKATRALDSLEQLLPAQARRVDPQGEEHLVPLTEVAPGDRLRVLPGERVPADSRILRGESSVDEQYFTGESRPVLRRAGESVLAGTLVLDSPLELQALAPAARSVLQQILEQVRQAFARRQGSLALVDRVVGVFAPAVLLLALGAAWWHAATAGAEPALLAALAVLLVACPCSLALATPLAVCGALGQAARAGVLIRSGQRLLLLGQARAVALDKTGTLTQDHHITRVELSPGVPLEEALRLAALLGRQTRHPAAQAVVEYAQNRLPAAPETSSGQLLGSRTLPGRGVTGVLQTESGRCELALGSPAWVAASSRQSVAALEAAPSPCARADSPSGKSGAPPAEQAEKEPPSGDSSQVWLARDGCVLARFHLQEKLRPGAVEALEQLARDGLHLVLLTGDRHVRVPELLGEELPLEIHAGLSPQQKIEHLRRLQARWGTVAMMGDGVNDAPALAQADVSLSLATGADVARDLADVCLLGQRLDRLGWVFWLGRRARRVVRWNLLWALAYNVVALPVAAAGYLHPIGAAVAMLGSSLLVTFNSLRFQQEAAPEV